MLITNEKTVGEIAAENPSSVRVFESLGIDYCCGGKRRLEDACSHAGISAEELRRRLEEAGRDAEYRPDANWQEAPLATLSRHIVTRYHDSVRREGPRIEALLAKVMARHGAGYPEIAEIQKLFTAAFDELKTHQMKEEQILFPYIERLEQAAAAGQPAPAAFFGSVARPIAHMMADHDDAGALFATMRTLAENYRPPAGACMSFQALYHGLDEFEKDLHEHIHLENNILFPRSLRLEEGF